MRKILLVRFSSIGDIVLTSPVVRCLHQAGDTEIHFLTREAYASLVAPNPYISRVITIRKSIREVIPVLRGERYDLVVDLHRNIRTTSLLLRLRRPFRRFRKLNTRKWLLVNFKWDLMPRRHIVDRYMDAVRGVAIPYDGLGLDCFIPPGEEVDIMELAGLQAGQYICVSAGSQHATKQLTNGMICSLAQQLGQPVVLLGSGEDRNKAAAILRECPDEGIIDLTGRLSLSQSASLIRQSSAVITGDTGIMHIAAALRKRVVSVWGNTVPEFGMGPLFPRGSEHLGSIIQVENLYCRPCSKLGYQRCPKGHFRCMNDIRVSRIVEEVLN